MDTVSLPHPNKLLVIEPLDYPNNYDFAHPHRHDYFELILVREGEGHQFIDFTQYELREGQLFVVYPGQVHLLKRNTTQGLLIQFRKDIFEFIFPLKHHYLYFQDPRVSLSEADFSHLYKLTERILRLSREENLSPLSIHKAYSYLQIILISLIEHHTLKIPADESRFAGGFLSLLSQHIRTQRKVADYAGMLHISTDKLTVSCKKSFGKTPLQLIHEELMLEIRRLMLLGELSLKEIAYELNFDSQANFSAFIKSATNKTPSKLQEEMWEVYK
jgi:AraC family transcriptional regulator, transcriptional activator of pobA